MNIPDRLASVILPVEGQRVTSVADGKMANAATFTFYREDHTLGNMLRMFVYSISSALKNFLHCCGRWRPSRLFHTVLCASRVHWCWVGEGARVCFSSSSSSTFFFWRKCAFHKSHPPPPFLPFPAHSQGALAGQRRKVCRLQAPASTGRGHCAKGSVALWRARDACRGGR